MDCELEQATLPPTRCKHPITKVPTSSSRASASSSRSQSPSSASGPVVGAGGVADASRTLSASKALAAGAEREWASPPSARLDSLRTTPPAAVAQGAESEVDAGSQASWPASSLKSSLSTCSRRSSSTRRLVGLGSRCRVCAAALSAAALRPFEGAALAGAGASSASGAGLGASGGRLPSKERSCVAGVRCCCDAPSKARRGVASSPASSAAELRRDWRYTSLFKVELYC